MTICRLCETSNVEDVKMNAITTRSTASTALAALKSLKAGIANVQQTMVKKSGKPYLRMLKDGEWVYGQEDIGVETGSLWAANPFSIEHGWTAWKRGEGVDNSGGPLGEVMVPMNQVCPAKTTLHDVGADWEYQMAIELKCLNGTDKGEEVSYKASSVGASKAMDALVKAIMSQLETDEELPIPIVSLDSSTYNHKKYGKTYEPVITIVEWAPMSDTPPEVGEPEEQAETEPAAPVTKPRTRSVPATTAKAEEPEDEIAALERTLLEKQAAKVAAAKAAKAAAEASTEDPIAKRKRELLAEMAALEAEGSGTAQSVVEAAQAGSTPGGQPLRRRRTT